MTDPQTIRRRAMLHIPATLLSRATELDAALRVANPAWATASDYEKRKLTETLCFYHLDKPAREVLVPRNFPVADYLHRMPEVVDETSEGEPAPNLQLAEGVSLRAYQQDFYAQQVEPSQLGGLTDLDLRMPCGHGKTVVAIYLSAQYGRRTLVCVTTHALAEQFRAAAAWLLPKASVGTIESGKPIGDWDVTVATYAMLSDGQKFPSAFFDAYGHVVCDEWHRTGARTRYPILERVSSRYRTFLSATMRRKDGLEEILKFHAQGAQVMARQTPGSTVLPVLTGARVDMESLRTTGKQPLPWGRLRFADTYEVQQADGSSVRGTCAFVDDTRFILQGADGREVTFTKGTRGTRFFGVGDVSHAKLDTTISEHPARYELVKQMLRTLKEKGRTTLVLSRRTQVLYDMAADLQASDPDWKIGVAISQKRKEQVEYCKALGLKPAEQQQFCVEQAETILGIDKMAEEGLDIDRLDTLVFLHPLKDIEQAAGRILRIKAGKRPPMIIYLCDDVRFYYAAWREAKSQFEELGHMLLAPRTWDDFMQQQERKPAPAVAE